MANRRVSRPIPNSAPSCLEQLVLDNLYPVRPIAGSIQAKIPVHIDLQDLIHDGFCGLVEAAKRYDVSRSVRFATYAKHRIRGSILDGLRRLDPAPRSQRAKEKRIDAAVLDLGNRLGRTPTTAEVAEETGIAAHHWNQPSGNGPAVGSTHHDTENSAVSPDELRADEASATDVMAARQELRRALAAAMAPLPRRDRQIVMLYHWRCATMREIGAQLGIKESRVSQIYKRALERMAMGLRSAGITSASSILLR